MSNILTACLVLMTMLATTVHAQQQPPPMTDDAAVRMLASDDWRERDAAMSFAYRMAEAGGQVSQALRDALIREVEHEDFGRGRPEPHPEDLDGWGEVWFDYLWAIAELRDPATAPLLLRHGCCWDQLADMGRGALLPAIVALEDGQSDGNTITAAFSTLAIMVYDSVPTVPETARIALATERLLTRGDMNAAVVPGIGLAMVLDLPALTAIVRRAAGDLGAAAALGGLVDSTLVQEIAREALRPGFIPHATRNRR